MSTDAFRVLQGELERITKLHQESPSDYTEGYYDAIDYAVYIMGTPEE